MHTDDLKCGGCGTALADAGPPGYYCPNKDCDYEWKEAGKLFAAMRERDERAEYERLKAKFGDSAPTP